jgi:hypothetical protein
LVGRIFILLDLAAEAEGLFSYACTNVLLSRLTTVRHLFHQIDSLDSVHDEL